MLYIISFQSISCPPSLRGGLQLGLRGGPSPRPHATPPKGSSIGHPLNLPPGFPHVAQLGPLAGSRGGFSGRFLETILFGSASQSSDQSSHRSSPQSSTRFSSRCLARPSGRSLKTILKPAREAVFATATLPTDTPVPSRRAEQSYNLSQTDL